MDSINELAADGCSSMTLRVTEEEHRPIILRQNSVSGIQYKGLRKEKTQDRNRERMANLILGIAFAFNCADCTVLPLSDGTVDAKLEEEKEGMVTESEKNRVKSRLLCANSFFVGECADAFDPGTNLPADVYFEYIRTV